MAERLALPTSDHGVAGSNPAEGEILPIPKRRFIAQSLSCSPFHRLEMTELLLKGCKTLTHPSIEISAIASRGIILSKQRTIKALIRLHRCTFVVRKCQNRFSYGVAQLYFHCKHKNNFSQQDNEPSNFESQTFKSPLIFAQSSKLPFEYCFL